MIRIDAAWLATAPPDMRAGTDTALARGITVFGAAHPHHAYPFAPNASMYWCTTASASGWSLGACTRGSSSGQRRAMSTGSWSLPNSLP